MALPSFAPLDATSYKWHPGSEPGIWQRRACGIENLDGLEIQNKKGHNDFYITVTSHFHDKHLKQDKLIRAIKQVWRRTCFHHPQVACFPVWKGGQLFLTYRPPAGEDEVARWVEKTVNLELSRKGPIEIQHGLEKRRRAAGGTAESSRPVSIHIIPSASTTSNSVSHSDVTFLFHLNHIFLDGSGAYSLIGLVLQDLALELSAPDEKPEQFAWENTVQNLPPAFIQIITADQHLSGPSYDKALQQTLADTMASQSSWGLKPSGAVSQAARNEFLVISAIHTDRIRSAARKAGFNITHLAHAAVFLVGLRANAPKNPTEASERCTIASYFALDDRQYIDDNLSKHKRLYLPNCHGHGNIMIDNIQEHVLEPRATPSELRRILIALAAKIKDCYDTCAQRPSRVSAGLAFMEMLAGMLTAYVTLGLF